MARSGFPRMLLKRPCCWHRCPAIIGSYFKRDLEIIRAAAECTSVREIRWEINFFHHQKTKGFERNVLHFRLSGKRLLSFAKKFLPPHQQNGGARSS